MLSWSCPVVGLDGRRAAVPENLQSLTAASGQDSSPLERACTSLPCVFCVTCWQVQGSLNSWPDWRHELKCPTQSQTSHSKVCMRSMETKAKSQFSDNVFLRLEN